MSFSPIQRVLRKVPALRALALIHFRRLRAQRAEESRSYDQSVMGMIGTMTVAWAGVERMMDELIAFHQQQFTDLSEEHPRGLSKKLDYIKRRLERDLKYPWGARDFFRQLRLEARRLGNERHEIIHGVLRRSGSSLVWQSQRVIYEKATARIALRDFHNDELVEILKQIGAFSHYISPRIWLLIGNDPARSPGGNIEEIHRELLRTHPPVKIP